MGRREDDARFLKSEKNLVKAAIAELKKQHFVTITKICQEAGVFTSTFYRHYHNLDELIRAREQKLLQEFRCSTIARRVSSLEQLFRNYLIFVYQHRDDFELSIITDQLGTPMTMLSELRQTITNGWRMAPAKLNRIYQVHSYEIVGILVVWAKEEQFNARMIAQYADELAQLTQTAVRRLSQLTT